MNGGSLKPADSWERMWAPYDAATYQQVLAKVSHTDTILEIGAGDLRLSRLLAGRARKVYAIEINREQLASAGADLPANLYRIHDDARVAHYPEGITTAVLLMRHCTHFELYYTRLKLINCRRLITNARWGMNVEVIDLAAPRHRYSEMEIGWYACCCGSRGFKPGPAELLTEENRDNYWELDSCPDCSSV
jgi:Ribosomal RNA adenine dimethylase